MMRAVPLPAIQFPNVSGERGITMNESDLELIRRFHAGNQQVFDEIYRRYGRRVHAWHRKRCRDHAKVDELAQLTMIKLYRNS
jgi:hypothetical protein